MQQQTKKRRIILILLEKQISSQNEKLISLKAEENYLQTLLHSLHTSSNIKNLKQPITLRYQSFSKYRGSLTWPIKGRLLAHYGSPRDIGKYTWKGIIIAAPSGANIVTSASGKVIFADWLRGLGLLIILDHGEQYMTLYGNNDALLKQEGDDLSANELIAQSSVRGMHKNSGLYFEIRHQGIPTDPLIWLKQ